MLSSLQIENVAVIQKAEVHFEPGLNVLTGETGAGKSICYQVPALLLPGITIVVSPLVSLMKDQVGALVQAGVAAAFLNNSLTDNQKALMLHRAREGWYKIIYVAPERLEPSGGGRVYGHGHRPCAGRHPRTSGSAKALRGDHQL